MARRTFLQIKSEAYARGYRMGWFAHKLKSGDISVEEGQPVVYHMLTDPSSILTPDEMDKLQGKFHG